MPGSQCCVNAPVLNSSSGVGQVKEIGGLKCYVSGNEHSKSSVILISDIFGYEAPKFRKIADKVAAAGIYTVAPDFFKGDAFVLGNAERPVQVWIKDYGFDQGFEDAKPVIEALKSKGLKVGAAGFCWGAKVVVDLTKNAHIEAGVLLHPTGVTLEDIHGVKVPISILGAEIDEKYPPEVMKQYETVLNAKPEVDSFVKIFPGVCHGWTTKYKDDDEHTVKSAEEAYKDLIDWFVKHLNK